LHKLPQTKNKIIIKKYLDFTLLKMSRDNEKRLKYHCFVIAKVFFFLSLRSTGST